MMTAAPKRTYKKKQKKNAPRKKFITDTEVLQKTEKTVKPLSFQTIEGDQVKIEVRTISPEEASEMLTKNTANRKKDERLIKSFVKKMEKGQWMVNGDTIRFDSNDVLRDGQNRLQAIVNSGLSQMFIIVTGLSPEAFATMDEGRKRSATDILSIEKMEDPSKSAALVKTVLLFKNGYYRSTKGGGDRSATPNNTEVKEFAREHKEKIIEAVEMAKELKKEFPYLHFKMSSALIYIFSEKGKKDAQRFFEELKTGKFEDSNSPVKLLRSEILKDSKRERKLPYNTILAYMIKTWNAFKSGETIDKLSYDKKAEKFPLPR